MSSSHGSSFLKAQEEHPTGVGQQRLHLKHPKDSPAWHITPDSPAIYLILTIEMIVSHVCTVCPESKHYVRNKLISTLIPLSNSSLLTYLALVHAELHLEATCWILLRFKSLLRNSMLKIIPNE